ncbi:MAG: 4Fe-4S binding protein [Clostridia bacterium]|nr:4Fe-4S binding protein [Clostridia bacterium]
MKRRLTQWISTILFNIQGANFFTGKISTSPTKNICVPGLNCYSCPGAIGSCPIGALQAVAANAKFKISLYVLGIMMLYGSLMGRWICGYACPFGLVQDLLYKIKTRKFKLIKPLKYGKYFVLVYFVLLFPVLFVNNYNVGRPGFCTYICPSGTLFASFPLLLTNPSLRNALGMIFNIKVAILLFILVSSVFVYRIFCQMLCPLGAFYAPFNKIAFYQYKVDMDICVECGLCEKACQMGINPVTHPNHLDCVRCQDCIHVCPVNAIQPIKHFTKPIQLEKGDIS